MVRIFINATLFQEVYIPAVTATAVINSFQITLDQSDLILDPGDVLSASTQNSESFNIYANGVDWVNCECSETCDCSDMVIIAHTGMVNIATGNPNRNGTGIIGTVFIAPVPGPTTYGSQIIKIDIKAIVSTTQGMIRFFINDTVANFLIWETAIPSSTQTNVQPAYRTMAIAAIDLQAGYSLRASTQNPQSFNIITFGSDITNCACTN